MKKLTQRAFAWMLVLVMVLSAVPFGVFAEGESPDAGNGEPAADVQAEGQTKEKETPKTEEKEPPKTEDEGTPAASNAEKGETPKAEEEKTPKTENSGNKNIPETENGARSEVNPEEQGSDKPVESETPSCTCANTVHCVPESTAGPMNKVINNNCEYCRVEGADLSKCLGAKPATVTITLNANGGTVNGKDSDSKEWNYDSSLLPNSKEDIFPTPVREGYSFEGWYRDDGVKYNAGEMIANRPMTFTAKWVSLSSLRNVTFRAKVGDDGTPVSISVQIGGRDAYIENSKTVTVSGVPAGTYTATIYVRPKEGIESFDKQIQVTVGDNDVTLEEVTLYPRTVTTTVQGITGAEVSGLDHVFGSYTFDKSEVKTDVTITLKRNEITNPPAELDGYATVEELEVTSIPAIGSPFVLQIPYETANKRVTVYRNELPMLYGDEYNVLQNALTFNTGCGSYLIGVKEAAENEAFTLVFDTAGGTPVPEEEAGVLPGRFVPDDYKKPTKENHVFLGWNTDPNAYMGMEMQTLSENDVKEVNGRRQVTLYAIWLPYKLNNSASGVTVTRPKKDTLTMMLDNVENARLEVTCTNGTDSDIAQKLTDAKIVSITMDKYVGEDKTNLTTLGGGKTMCFTVDISELLGEEGEIKVLRNHGGEVTQMTKLSAEPTDGTTEGYYVSGNSVKIYSANFSNFGVGLQKEADTVTITYHDGTTGTSNKDVTASVKKGEKFQPSAMPDSWTKTGYSLEKWEAKVDEQTTQDYELDKQYEVTEDRTLTAVWKPITYTVTFDGNGGTLTGTNPVDAVYDVAVTAPAATRTYYTLLGWATKADAQKPDYAANTELKNLTAQDGGKVTLYAVWSYVPRNITLDAKGGTLTDANGKDVKTLTVQTTAARDEKGKDYNVLTAKNLQTPAAPEGKTFAGWYTTEDNKGIQIEANDIIPDNVTTLYAHWNDFQSVDVTLKAMGGTMKLDGKTVREGTIATKWPGVLSQTLPTPARTGYKFLGWYTADGYKVDQNTRYTGTTNVIYAHWERAVSRTGNPKTGDQVRLGLAVGVLAVAAVGLTTAVVLRKRKK